MKTEAADSLVVFHPTSVLGVLSSLAVSGLRASRFWRHPEPQKNIT